jgi:hypothetical protein
MDDIVEDARRETEVLLSTWENQNYGRSHDHGYNGCNMFVPFARPDSFSSEDLGNFDGACENAICGRKRAVTVTWAESDTFMGKASNTRRSSSVSPGDIRVQDPLAEGTSLGARSVA